LDGDVSSVGISLARSSGRTDSERNVNCLEKENGSEGHLVTLIVPRS
jgi:hypothetical protein